VGGTVKGASPGCPLKMGVTMNTRATKPSREPSHSPTFIKAALIVLLMMFALILVAKFVAGVKLHWLGL
jgi:hypothetical protein